jgi:hypothetical protein
MNIAQPTHTEPCGKLQTVAEETARQGAKIENVESFTKHNHDTLEDVKTALANHEKKDARTVLIMSFTAGLVLKALEYIMPKIPSAVAWAQCQAITVWAWADGFFTVYAGD